MALKKNITLKNGLAGNYHKIIGFRINPLVKTANISVGLIKDSDFSKEVTTPDHCIEVKNFQVKKEKYSQLDGGIPTAYEYLKTLPEYEDASDC